MLSILWDRINLVCRH